MSNDIFKDMNNMHHKFGVHEVVDLMDKETLQKFLEFRISMMEEELEEIKDANYNEDPEELIDGIIDLIVFAAGTLDLYDIDGNKAWNEVLRANLEKKVGIKEGRENPFGLPDLIKPEGWIGPSHSDNISLVLEETMNGFSSE